MEAVARRYPQVELGPENISAFKADWLSLLQQIGTERFLVAVQRACQSTCYFPLLADIVKHVPPPPAVSTYSGPSAEDLRRKAVGERNYGQCDVKCLAAMQRQLRSKVNRPLTDGELDGLIADLDRRIDSQNQRKTEFFVHDLAEPSELQGRIPKKPTPVIQPVHTRFPETEELA